jgi:hypothetical protein
VALALLATGCRGGDESANTTAAKANASGASVCGYGASGADAIPEEVAKVLPGHWTPPSNAAGADGGFSAEVAVDVLLRKAFDGIVQRGQAQGWTLGARQREVADAELSMTRGQERLEMALSTISGCSGTRVELTYAPAP